MSKLLRYSLISLMMLLGMNAYADTVVFDFTGDDAYSLFGFTGFSSGSGDNYVADGDFTETKAIMKDGVSIVVSPSEGNTPNRMWKGSLRMYGGILAFASAEEITSIEFETSKWNDGNSSPMGTLEKDLWTGSAQNVSIVIAGNTQIKKITVTTGEGGYDDPDDDDDGLLSGFDFTSGTITSTDNQLTFDFTAHVKKIEAGGLGTLTDVDVSGKIVFDFENDLCTKCTMTLNLPSEEIAQYAYLQALADAAEAGYTKVEVEGKTLTIEAEGDYVGQSKITIKSLMKVLSEPDAEFGMGVLESPFSPNQANILAGSLEKDQVTEDDIFIKGKIASILYPFSADYGTATFFISADGQDDFTFECYSVYYLENKAWVEGFSQVQVGDEVIICGKVTNFKGKTPETASKKAYIYSLNGKTKAEGGETPQPQVTNKTVAEALAIINGLEDGKTTAEEYQVKGFVVGAPDFQRKADGTLYGNVNLDIADEKGGTAILTVFRGKSYDKESFTEETISLIKEGDEVVFQGKLQKYMKNGEPVPELTNGYLISVTSGEATAGQVWDFTKWSDATVAALKADAAASKTSGWSDVEKAKDAEDNADPTEASKDNCFWSVATPNADGTLSANGVVIEELKGLVWNSTYTVKRSLAIAVNYPNALSEYAGGAYLWLGGGKNKIPCFTIPGVKAGSAITMEVESHKASEGRGIELYTGVDGDGLVDAATKIGDSFTPKTKEAHTWTIDNDCDVIVYNTNGCHIYRIEIGSAAGIVVPKADTTGNGFIYNIAGQRVNENYKGVVIKNGRKFYQK